MSKVACLIYVRPLARLERQEPLPRSHSEEHNIVEGNLPVLPTYPICPERHSKIFTQMISYSLSDTCRQR